MSLISVLRGEHACHYAIFSHLEAEVERGADRAALAAGTAALNAILFSHAEIEERLLFPALAERVGVGGPIAVMTMEHRELDAQAGKLAMISGRDDFVQQLRRLIVLARDHFAKEEHVLFPLADRLLPPDERQRLAREWGDRRGVAMPEGPAPHC